MSKFMQKPWLVEGVRLTAFFEKPITNDTAKLWWNKTVGDDFQDMIARPREQLFALTGEYNDGRLDLRVQGNRVDWLHHKGMPILPKGEDCFLGFGEDVIPLFIQTVSKWLSHQQNISENNIIRIAASFTIWQPIKSDDINVHMKECLPFINFEHIREDFRFQLNEPYFYKVDNDKSIKINQIKIYSVETIAGANIGFSNNGIDFFEERFSRIEIDINTPSENSQPLNKYLSFSELVEDISRRL